VSTAPIERTLEVRRTARYFELGGEGPVPPDELWYVLHGYGQAAAEVAQGLAFLGTPARRLVVPEALSRFYRNGTSGVVGASWMTKLAREAEIEDYVAYLEALHARVRSQVGGAPALTLLGFSQGTATASRWVAKGSVRPARLILWGGALAPDVDVAADREAFRGLSYVAGEHDHLITRERLAEDRARVEAAGLAFRLTTFDGGHRLDVGVLRALAAG
jgi:predicted esterase